MKVNEQPATGRLSALGAAIVANVVVLGAFVWFWVLAGADPDAFHASVQEDEYLEWATFWAFLFAAGASVVAAVRQRRAARRDGSGLAIPWFFVGVALFCTFVAMEEISWGQRVLGYRPPAYFLANNFQQELNLHNIASSSLRELVFNGILLGYGLLLPLLAWIPATGRLLRRLAIVGPLLGLAPAFVATSVVSLVYPLPYTGEIAELMMGLSFLVATAVRVRELRPAAGELLPAVVVALVLPVGLGFLTAAAASAAAVPDPARVAEAEREVAALGQDLGDLHRAGRGALTRMRGLHKRVYSYVEKYGRDGATALDSGTFAALTAQGLPDERARFYLDPWNSPYWLGKETTADGGYAVLMIYSFGPNRRRESTDWEVLGDDVGLIIATVGERPANLPVTLD